MITDNQIALANMLLNTCNMGGTVEREDVDTISYQGFTIAQEDDACEVTTLHGSEPVAGYAVYEPVSDYDHNWGFIEDVIETGSYRTFSHAVKAMIFRITEDLLTQRMENQLMAWESDALDFSDVRF